MMGFIIRYWRVLLVIAVGGLLYYYGQIALAAGLFIAAGLILAMDYVLNGKQKKSDK
ncbi:MAG: hypothetical protein ACJAT1_000491 [Marivirga sp.]|jgi:hypothetical protein